MYQSEGISNVCERELLVGNVREREGERGHYRQMTVFVHHIVMIVWVHTHIICLHVLLCAITRI